ncbi:MAG: hypothetical protein SPL56_00420 [Lachnospiraceae bacterium]|nr:hypothetical protein [Lachnospiraceae bacterium]
MKKHKKRGTSYLLSAVMIGALLAGTGVSALAEGEPGTVGAENTSVGISAPESNGTATSSESSSTGSGTDGSTGDAAFEGQSSDGTVNQIIGGSGSAAEGTAPSAGEDASGEGSKSEIDAAGVEQTASDEESSTEGSTTAETAETAATDMTGDSAAEEELSYPAFTDEIDTGDGVVVSIDAPEGAFPAGIQCAVTKVDSALILPAIQTAENDTAITADDIVAYDFDFYLGDQHEIEPLTAISVTYSGLTIEDGDTAALYHLEDDTAAAEQEATEAVDQKSGTLQFSSSAFSIHAAVLRAGESSNQESPKGFQIYYDGHFAHKTADGGIVLFCMNNDKMHWPHTTDTITKVPNYIQVGDNKYVSQEKWDEFIHALKVILFAGYPNNGMGLYTITSTGGGTQSAITEEEYNQMLNPPVYIRADFPESIGTTEFHYSDYLNNPANINKLREFITAVIKLQSSGGKTTSGMTSSQITSTPFYQAAYCMVMGPDYSLTPVECYYINYSRSFEFTEQEAYDATNAAVWNLMQLYGVANNTGVSVNPQSFPAKLLDLVNDSNTAVPESEPSREGISVTTSTGSSNASFTYNPSDGKWYSDALVVNVPAGYYAQFQLTLPEGVYLADGKTTVQAGQAFTLVSDNRPEGELSLTASATIKWVNSISMYTPAETVTLSDGFSGFQDMVGADVQSMDVSASIRLSVNQGSLSVEKKVVGNSDAEKTFEFTVTLTGCTKLNGVYGGMTFQSGVATFMLTNGEKCTATGLPAGVSYQVNEKADDEYSTSSSGATGQITTGITKEAVFTNTYKKPTGSLEIVKKSTGAETPADTQFVIRNANGTEEYEKIVRYSDFADGKVTVENIPVGTYTVTESTDTAQVPGYSLTVDGGNGMQVKVENSQTASVTINNTYTRNTEEKPSSDGGNSGTTENSGNSGNTENSSSNPSSQAKPTKTTPVQKAQENTQPANQTVETVAGTEHAAENPAGYGVLGAGRGKNGSATNGANVQTGDNSHMTGWLVLAVISAALLVTFEVFRKKREDQE